MLDERKRQVLRAIIQDYVRTAEPVGSERLVETHDFHARAATIRNEMAALSNLGYLLQPHTSAGRIPSDKGYRLYVDELMGAETGAGPRMTAAVFRDELDEVLRQTCRMLAGITHCAAVATRPSSDAVTLQQVYITPVAPTRVLVVAILSSGEVEHRFAELSAGLSASTLTRLINVLNDQLSGHQTRSLRHAKVALPSDMQPLADAAAAIVKALNDAVRRDESEPVVVEGATRVLREPEFQDEDRRERLLRALEDRRDLLESLRTASEDVEVIIGSENPLPSMREFSFVSARYRMGDTMSGVVGIFGPTRMAYRETRMAVRKASRFLSECLGRLSLR